MSSTKSEAYFTVKAGKYTYYMVIKTIRDLTTNEPISYGIDFGGALKGCMNITVENIKYIPQFYKDRFAKDEIAAYQNAKQTAHISWIGYHEKCTLGQDMLKMQGTRHMVRTALTQVMKKFQWICSFMLEDASQVECKPGLVISLFEYSILTNRKSYYEKYFGAKLNDATTLDDYIKCISSMESSDLKSGLTFASFLIACRLTDVNVIFTIEPIYNNSSTFLELFQNIKFFCQESGKLFCEFVYPWGQTFVKEYILKGKRFAGECWIISGSTVSLINTTDWKNTEEREINNINANREDLRKVVREQRGGHFIGYCNETHI